MHAHNGSGFDTWTFLNNLPCDERVVINIKIGKQIIEIKVCNGYIGDKRTPQCLHFRCDVTHLHYSLKKLGRTFKF